MTEPRKQESESSQVSMMVVVAVAIVAGVAGSFLPVLFKGDEEAAPAPVPEVADAPVAPPTDARDDVVKLTTGEIQNFLTVCFNNGYDAALKDFSDAREAGVTNWNIKASADASRAAFRKTLTIQKAK